MTRKPVEPSNLTTADPATCRGLVRLKIILDLAEVARPPAPCR
jgi:hypothetical protein